MITGSPEPNQRKAGKIWMNVAIAAIRSEDWIRITLSAWDKPATPDTTIAGVTQPTTMARTCCSERGSNCSKGSFPRQL